MNLKLEIYLALDEDQFSQEEIARLAISASDQVVVLGYGNVGAQNAEHVRLKSVVVVRPEATDCDEKWWKKIAKGAMVINFPTDDETFIEQAAEGGIPGT